MFPASSLFWFIFSDNVRYQMNNYIALTNEIEGEEEKVRGDPDPTELTLGPRGDPRVKKWLETEGLSFLLQDLCFLTYPDLLSIAPDEIKQLSYKYNTSQKIRFKNAIKELQTRYSIKRNVKKTKIQI